MLQPAKTLALRTFFDAKVRTLSFALFFAFYALVQGIGYRREFPTLADRESFARSFGASPAVKLFYGIPHDLVTVGGYAEWRVAGVLTLFAAFFGLWSAVRVFRGDEESGRQELIAASSISRGGAFSARGLAALATILGVWLATLAGLLAGGLSPGGSAILAVSVASVALVYAGVGALVSQLIPSSRGALNLGLAVFALDALLRIVSDIGNYPVLHWAAPLGWAEEMRPFTGPRPAVFLLPFATALVLLIVAAVLNSRRDVGDAVFRPQDVRRPRRWLLGSPTALALRTEVMSLVTWLLATTVFGAVLGVLSKTVASADLPQELTNQVGKFGANISTPDGLLGLYFIFFVLAISFFCCTQLASLRGDEADGRLETLFALPEGRLSWMAGRLVLAAGAATALGLAAGLSSALGATFVGTDVSYARLLEAGLNCLPASLLFLGLGALLVAIAPRLGVGVIFALVSVAFVWELVGALVGMPSWLLGVSPFHQVGLVPAAAFRATPAIIMLLIGALATAVSLWRFRFRDIVLA